MMNLIRQLFVVVVSAAAMMGSAQAQTNLGTLSSNVTQQSDFIATSGMSFADIFNFTLDANHTGITGSIVNFSPDGVDASMTHVSNVKFELFSGFNALGSNLLLTDGFAELTRLDVNAGLAPGEFSAQISGTADGPAGGGFLFSVAATPEPAEWMMLLAGLVVVGFMARRKASLVTG